MRAVDLDEVEPGLLRTGGRERILLDQLLDVVLRQLARHGRARRERHGRRRDRFAEERLATGMPQLDADRDAVRAQGVDKLPQAWNELVAVQAHLGADAVAIGCDEAGLDRDHPDATLGAPAVVRDRALVDGTVVLGEACPHRRHHDPIGKPEPRELERRVEVGERRAHAVLDSHIGASAPSISTALILVSKGR